MVIMSHKSEKLICKKCDNNVSNKSYAKSKSYLSKIKKLDQIVLQKGLFASIKGHFCLRRRHLENLEGQVKVKSLLIASYF